MMLVVTEARVRSWWVLPRFVWHSVSAVRQAETLPGCLGTRVFLGGPLLWYTATVWREEADMRDFVRSGAHRRAMRETRRLTATTRFGRAAWADADLRGLTLSQLRVLLAPAA